MGDRRDRTAPVVGAEDGNGKPTGHHQPANAERQIIMPTFVAAPNDQERGCKNQRQQRC